MDTDGERKIVARSAEQHASIRLRLSIAGGSR